MGRKDINLKWIEPGGEKDLDVVKMSAVDYEIVMTGTEPPSEITFTAAEKGTTNSIKLNGEDFITLKPTLEKKVTTIQIFDESKYSFFLST